MKTQLESTKAILKEENGVTYLSHPLPFDAAYLAARKKEQRIYLDQVVGQLPQVPKAHDQYSEWQMRKVSTDRTIAYLRKEFPSATILDLGAGNGWFSAHIAKALPLATVYAVDINADELEQAARVFSLKNVHWLYGDIFEELFASNTFDVVLVNSVLQYFDSPERLIKQLAKSTKKGGEIHIWDSPIYPDNAEASAAKKRTENYYEQLGVPAMLPYYHHHTAQQMNFMPHSYCYSPSKLKQRLGKITRKAISPFPWIKYKV